MSISFGREFVEMEFRDGDRLVADYLATLMHGLETHRMTYEEAIILANKRLEADHLNAKRDAILAAHFRELR